MNNNSKHEKEEVSRIAARMVEMIMNGEALATQATPRPEKKFTPLFSKLVALSSRLEQWTGENVSINGDIIEDGFENSTSVSFLLTGIKEELDLAIEEAEDYKDMRAVNYVATASIQGRYAMDEFARLYKSIGPAKLEEILKQY